MALKGQKSLSNAFFAFIFGYFFAKTTFLTRFLSVFPIFT